MLTALTHNAANLSATLVTHLQKWVLLNNWVTILIVNFLIKGSRTMHRGTTGRYISRSTGGEMVKALLLISIAIATTVFTSTPAMAGTLDDFERDSTSAKPEESRSSTPTPTLCRNTNCDKKHDPDNMTLESLFIDMLSASAEGVTHVFTYGTQVTIDRTSPYSIIR